MAKIKKSSARSGGDVIAITMNTKDAAKYLSVAVRYLYQLKFYDRGPRCIKKAGRIYYTKDALDTWNASRKKRGRPSKSLKKAA